MSKYEDTRIVTFKEDYTVPTESGGARVLYKKSSVHAIHKSIAAKLEKVAKVSVEKLDHKKVIDEKKESFAKRKQVTE